MKKGKANLSKVIIFVDVQNKGYKGKKKKGKKILNQFLLRQRNRFTHDGERFRIFKILLI